MLDIQQKRKVRAVMYNRVTLGFLFVLVLLALHSTWRVYNKKMASEQMKNITMEQVKGLRDRNSDLEAKIDELATVSGIEQEIRSKFSVAKDNERMVVVVPSTDSEATSTPRSIGFWESLKNYFFGK